MCSHLRFVLLVFLLAIAASARADDYSWQGPDLMGGDGDFNGANWFDSTTQRSRKGPPGGGDTAFVDSGNLSCSGGGVDTLEITPQATLNLGGGFSVNHLGSVNLTGSGSLTATDVGHYLGDTANHLKVDGASLTVNGLSGGLLYADVSGGGSVVVKVSAPRGTGSVTGARSLLEVDGTLMNFNGGALGGGTITAQGLGSDNGLSGVISCDGAGSTVSDSGRADFDGQGVYVTNGGQVNVAGNLVLASVPSPFVGRGSFATVDGAGSALTVGGSVFADANGVANGYGGNLTVSNGARLHADTLFLDDGPLHAGHLGVSGGAVQLDTGLSVGKAGAGAVDIDSGGSLAVSASSGGAVAVGLTSGGRGTITIDGAGSSLNTGGALAAIGKDPGTTGTVMLTNAAAMQAGPSGAGGGAYLHVADGGKGTLTLSGGSSLKVVGALTPTEIGSVANSDGEVDLGAGCTMNVDGSLALANQGSGTLNVGGAGAAVTVGGNFYMGYSPMASGAQTPVGILRLSGGAGFTAGNGKANNIGIGYGANSIATVTVSGAGTTLNLQGATILGVGGQGTLTMDSGATAQFLALEVGGVPGSLGSLGVYGGGTAATVTNFLLVGGASGMASGTGVLNVDSDGVLTVGRELFVSATGTVIVKSSPLPDGSPATAGGRIFVGTDNVGPDGAVRVGHGGVLSGKGKQTGTTVRARNIFGNVIIGAGGKFRPGGDPDVFSVDGDCDLSDGGAGGGETDVEIGGGGTAGTDYDQLVVSGKLTLGGTLNLVLLPGYAPKAGDTFNFFQAGSVTGNFTQVSAPGLMLATNPTAGSLGVTVTAVTVSAPPVITSAAAVTATLGAPFAFQVTATNSPAGYTATGLPDGLEVDPASGLIAGTPTTAGTFNVALTATNVVGTGTATLALTVAATPPPGSPVITSAATASAQVGVAFSYQIAASGAPTVFAAGGLPGGLGIDPATGLISGTPTGAGTFTVALSAANAIGTGTATLVLIVTGSTKPVLTATASVNVAHAEAGTPGAFTISLSPPPGVKTVVKYTLKGSAVNGKDYNLLTGKAKIKPNKTGTTVQIVPRGSGAAGKTVKLALTPGDAFTVGNATAPKVKIKP